MAVVCMGQGVRDVNLRPGGFWFGSCMLNLSEESTKTARWPAGTMLALLILIHPTL